MKIYIESGNNKGHWFFHVHDKIHWLHFCYNTGCQNQIDNDGANIEVYLPLNWIVV